MRLIDYEAFVKEAEHRLQYNECTKEYAQGVRDTLEVAKFFVFERPQSECDCSDCDYFKFSQSFIENVVKFMTDYNIETVEGLNERVESHKQIVRRKRMNNDLISRSDLKKKIEEVQYTQEFCIEHQIDYSVSMQMLGMVIDNAPTVEPRTEYGTDGQAYRLFISGGQVVPDMLQGWKYEERPQGEWEWVQYDANPNIGNWHCSECRYIPHGKKEYQKTNFCPNCGADMRKEAEND